ncbi:MAG: TetM/TetW/TetO/TetS family tetracycline resistance ribosomal protection protein [Clostridiales bacterium]|nr:TetM/TetW/TetO/TetS family tetracycline resistance ribosomal protection protein [Clostridiales bacterium]
MKITFGILAHVDAGKTTFSEQILYQEKVIRTLGRVDSQTACLDHDEIEKTRGITIFSDMACYTHNDNTYYLVDTPGHVDFSAEMERTLEIMDYAILVVNGSDGVQGHTETIWKLLERYQIPVFLFINKLDIPTASYELIVKELKNQLSDRILDFQDMNFKNGMEGTFTDDLIDNVSELDEGLVDEWLEGTMSYEDMKPSLLTQIKKRRLFPCFGGSALKGAGLYEFLTAFYELAQTSYETSDVFRGRVFKIRYDEQQERMTYLKVLSGSVKVRDIVSETEKIHQIRLFRGEKFTTATEATAGDVVAVTGLISTVAGQGLGACQTRENPYLYPALQARVQYPPDIPDQTVLRIFHMLEEEDPSLKAEWEESLQQLKVNVMGRIQLEVLEETVLRKYQVPVTFGNPEVVYMETVKEPVYGYGHFEPLRHYAEVALRIEPAPRGEGITFESECHVDRLGINYQNLIRTHVFETVHKGILTGSSLTDVKIVLIDGISHIKHTEGGDFREAVYRAIRQGLMKADNLLLEPYYRFSLSIPDTLAGKLLNDITRRYGVYEAPVMDGSGRCVVTGTGPVSSFMNYGEELLMMTGGRAGISMNFSHYDICHNQDEVVASYHYNADADVKNPSCSVFCHKGTSCVVNWNKAEDYMHTLR